MKLSKTDFLIYRDCAHNMWVKIHASEIYRAKPLSLFEQGLLETGNEVDRVARELFPHGVLVGRGDAEGQRVSSRNARQFCISRYSRRNASRPHAISSCGMPRVASTISLK